VIRSLLSSDFDAILEVINDAAQAYKGVIPDDRWKEPYMSAEELRKEVEAGVQFFGQMKGEHLLGVVATYEILPILNGSLAWIFSFSDQSSLIQPGLALSISDEAEFLFGAMIGLGARPKGSTPLTLDLKSEFGTYPNIYYMEFKFYF